MAYLSFIFTLLLVQFTSALQRLPSNIAPEHYRLSILTDLDKLQYYGQVTILVNCKVSTSTMTLHASKKTNNLEVQDASVTTGRLTDEELVKTIDFELNRDFMVISLKQPLKAGQKYILHIRFEGSLKPGFDGYNLIMYQNNNDRKMMTMTNFKHINARNAFPCFDEPGMKAVFSIKLGHREHFTSVSNAPIKRTVMSHDYGWVWDEYEDTPLLSTYQVAFSVLDESLKLNLLTGVPLPSLYTTPEEAVKVLYAYKTVPVVIKAIQKFIKVNIPLPKIDLLVLPSSKFSIQAFWGLVPVLSGYLDEDTQHKAVSHERITRELVRTISQQWFGNYVSIKWWDDYWFFCSVSIYITEIIPLEGYENSESKLIEMWSAWSDWDSLPSSSTLSKKTYLINNSINLSPSLLVLHKGTLLMRMVYWTFGPEIFQKSLQEFVKKYATKTSGPEEFFDVLSIENGLAKGSPGNLLKVSNILKSPLLKYKYWGGLTLARMGYKVVGKPQTDDPPITHATLPPGVTVKQLMDNWVNKPGYPVIYVTRVNNGVVHVTQKRFLSERKSLGRPRGCWWIPLTYSSANKLQFDNMFPKEWLGCEHYTTGITFKTGAGPDDWIIFNNRCSGLYRVQYDDHNWNLITNALKSAHYWKIHEFNRVQLVNDALSLAWSGELSYTMAFNLLSYLHQEKSYLQWRILLKSIKKIDQALHYTRKYEQFKKIMKPVLTPIFNSIFRHMVIYAIFNNIKTVDLEMDIFEYSCRIGVERCIEQLPDVFETFKRSQEDPEVVFPYPQRMAKDILCYAIKYGNKDEDFDYLKNRLKKLTNPGGKLFYFEILSCTENETHINELLEWTIDGSENAVMGGTLNVDAFKILIRTRSSNPLASSFFFYRFDDIDHFLSYYVGDQQLMAEYVEEFAHTMSSLMLIRQMKEFLMTLQRYPHLQTCLESLQRGITSAMPSINWVARNYNTFDEILQETPMDENKPMQPTETLSTPVIEAEDPTRILQETPMDENKPMQPTGTLPAPEAEGSKHQI